MDAGSSKCDFLPDVSDVIINNKRPQCSLNTELFVFRTKDPGLQLGSLSSSVTMFPGGKVASSAGDSVSRPHGRAPLLLTTSLPRPRGRTPCALHTER